MAMVAGVDFGTLSVRETEEVNVSKITVSGEREGEAIVIAPADHQSLIIGFRSSASLNDPVFQWPAMKNVHLRRVRWVANHWEDEGEPSCDIDQSHKTLSVDLNMPQAVLVTW